MMLQERDDKLVLSAGTPAFSGTTITLDRGKAVAKFEYVTFFVFRKTDAVPFGDIRELSLKPETDAASGAERYLPVIRLTDGQVLALPPIDERDEAEEAAARIRRFVGLRN